MAETLLNLFYVRHQRDWGRDQGWRFLVLLRVVCCRYWCAKEKATRDPFVLL